MASAPSAQPATSSITMEFAAKSIPAAKSSIVVLVFVSSATMDSMLIPMVPAKPGKTLIQLSMAAVIGKTMYVLLALPNIISMPMESVSQSVINAENGISPADNVLHATSATSSITVLVLLTQPHLEPLMLPVIPTAKPGTAESVKLVLTELSSIQTEFVKVLMLTAILGIMLMDFALVVIQDITLLMEFVNWLQFKDQLT